MIPSCRDIATQATEFQEGALPYHRSVAFRVHLAICKGCRALLRQLELTAALLRNLPRPEVPAAAKAAVLAAFRATRPPP